MWDMLFTFTNILALAGWLVLIALPRKQVLLNIVLYIGIGVLCAAYSVLLVGLGTGVLELGSSGEMAGGLSGYSIDALMQLFQSRGGMVVGWTHYLALDLFAGLWIAQDADRRAVSRLAQLAILLLTFLAGPAGLLIWLVVRWRREAVQ